MRKIESCIDYAHLHPSKRLIIIFHLSGLQSITKTAQDTRQHASQPLHSSHKSTPVTTILLLIHTSQHSGHPYTQKRGKVI